MIVCAERLDDDGRGVGTAGGLELHVADLLPGETAEVEIDHRSRHRQQAWATIRRRDGAPSPERVTPACPGFGRCGGCAVQNLSYPAQLAAKQARVERALAGAPVEPIVGSPRQLEYRNKGKYVIARDGERWVLGAYEPRTHRVVDTIGCRVVEPAIDAAARQLVAALAGTGLAVYDERTRHGELRYAVIRANAAGDALVAIVTTSAAPREEIARLGRAVVDGGASGAVWVRNDATSGAIVSGETELVAGAPAITETIAGVDAALGAGEFFQVNRDQALRLYADVARRAGAGPAMRAVDLYGGVGGIAFTLAAAGASVVGIERHEPSVRAAEQAARAAGLPPAQVAFHVGTADTLAAAGRPDLVVVNPPRKGLDAATRAALAEAAPSRIVYVSCNPDTLARDIGALHDYRLVSATPYDLMPGTMQVETLAVLERR